MIKTQRDLDRVLKKIMKYANIEPVKMSIICDILAEEQEMLFKKG